MRMTEQSGSCMACDEAKSISSRARKNANRKPGVQCTELVFTGRKMAGAEQSP
jgi:hypothetical protein